MKSNLLVLSAVMAIATATVPANATTPLSPTVLDPGQTLSALPDFSDGVVPILPPPYFVTFSFGNASEAGPVGTLTEILAYDSQVSPFGPGGDIFAYELTVTKDDVAEISFPGFGGFGTAVKTCDANCIEGNGQIPFEAVRSSNGAVISFLFNGPLTGSSGGFSIYTNATTYTDPPIYFTDSSGVTDSVRGAFGPGAVPEPSTWAMLLLGFAGLGLAGYRRKKKSHAALAAA